MKLLTLSRNKLDLAHLQLRKPLIIVGRSPTCDVVLRAPGIQPIHFIIEWIGNGKFDPKAGQWSIVDVSKNAEAGEGLVLGKQPLKLGDITFIYADSLLESSEVIGGNIISNLSTTELGEPDLLEFVQVRNDSGMIEEVRHVPITKKAKVESLSKEFRAFKVEHSKMKTDQLLTVLLQELPGAQLFMSGRRIEPTTTLALRANDFLQVKWNGRDFYLRFVEEVKSPPIAKGFFDEPLLKYLTLGFTVLLALFLMLRSNTPEEIPPEPAPRVARVELPKPETPAATPAPPPPKAPEAEKKAEVEPPKVQPEKIAEITKTNPEKKVNAVPPKVTKTEKIAQVTDPKKSGKAAAAKNVVSPDKAVKSGLNNKAKPANVNSIGLLATLNKTSNKGSGVSADKVLNNGLIRNTLPSNDNAKVMILSPPAGVIGKGSGGSPNGKATDTLGSASTTLSGVKNASPDSKSLFARAHGSGDSRLGTGGDGAGASTGNRNSSQIGSGAGDFSVEGGGLDRETVRRIILSYRGQIRACYERTLITSPNLQGRIVYQWRIMAEGGVVEAKILKATLDSTKLKSCVLDVIQQMQFPRSPKNLPTVVIYPFVFQGQN